MIRTQKLAYQTKLTVQLLDSFIAIICACLYIELLAKICKSNGCLGCPLDDNNGLFIGDNGYLCPSFSVAESFLFT